MPWQAFATRIGGRPRRRRKQPLRIVGRPKTTTGAAPPSGPRDWPTKQAAPGKMRSPRDGHRSAGGCRAGGLSRMRPQPKPHPPREPAPTLVTRRPCYPPTPVPTTPKLLTADCSAAGRRSADTAQTAVTRSGAPFQRRSATPFAKFAKSPSARVSGDDVSPAIHQAGETHGGVSDKGKRRRT